MISAEVTNVAWCPTALDKVALCIEENGLSMWRGRRGKRKEDDLEDSTIDKCREAKGNGCLDYMATTSGPHVIKLYCVLLLFFFKNRPPY